MEREKKIINEASDKERLLLFKGDLFRKLSTLALDAWAFFQSEMKLSNIILLPSDFFK